MRSDVQFKLASFLLGVVLLVGVSACAEFKSRPQVLHPSYGQSMTAVRQAQVLDPDASANLTPVRTMDGGAAAATHAEYVKSFTPKPGAKAASAFQGLSGIGAE